MGKRKGSVTILLACILLVAFGLRLGIALYSTEIPTGDASGYDIRAMNILEGKGFSMYGKPTSSKDPFYSFFLASVYYFYGHSYKAVRIIQAIFGVLACFFIFLIAKQLFDENVGLVSAAIACFHPAFIKGSEHLHSENIYMMLLLLSIFFLIRYIRDSNIKTLIASSFILGIAALTRSVVIFLPIFIAGYLFYKTRRHNLKLSGFVLPFDIFVYLFVFLLTIAPWTIRNWRIQQRFIPVSTNIGIVFYSSYAPKDGKLYGFDADDEITRKAKKIDSEPEQARFLVQEALKIIRKNPLRLLKLEILKTAYFWNIFDWEVIGYGVYNFMYVFILSFFIYGVFITFKRSITLLPVHLPVVYSFFIALVTYGSPRFRLPIEPYIIILGSAGIVYFVQSFSKIIYSIFLIIGFFILNLFLYFNGYNVKLFIKSILEKNGLW